MMSEPCTIVFVHGPHMLHLFAESIFEQHGPQACPKMFLTSAHFKKKLMRNCHTEVITSHLNLSPVDRSCSYY